MQRLFVLSLAACAAHTSSSLVRPDYNPIAAEAAPPTAMLYADCLGDAAAAHRFGRATDADTTLLVFTCTGAPARAFYDGLAEWSARIGSQFQDAGRTFRSTARVRHDLFGVDYCATDGTAYSCVISLNAGPFVR